MKFDFTPLDEKTVHCEQHGEYLSQKFHLGGMDRWTPCAECDKERQKAETRREQEELHRYRLERLTELAIKQAAIPRRFANRTLATYKTETDEQARALAVSTDYAGNLEDALATGRSLIFCGLPGTGKTHLAIGIAHTAIENGLTAGFISAMNAVRRVRETYRRDSPETERQAIKSFADPDLLIIDEVGQQRGTDDEKVLLFDIINTRYEAMRPIIVISNLDLEGIKGYLGERAFDRLREGGGRAVNFTWESYRRSA